MKYSNLKRFYTDQDLSQNIHVNFINNKHHYLKNVMRLKSKDLIRLFNGKDGEWLVKIENIEKKSSLLLVQEQLSRQKNSPDIWLIFSPVKKDRLNILVQKTTELGVKRFIPIKTQRTNIKNVNIINLKHNIIEASEQSERLDIPIVQELLNFGDFINSWPEDRCLLYCDESSPREISIISKILEIKKEFSKWSILIGSEGGFSSKERSLILKLKNSYPVSLGKRVLRSDTAATAALFSLQQLVDN
ncbi:MAG: Ribosomal RNA small subunit methyltransferase E [Alphaproteobacteria bacterium MarineAlpha5_Bin11]|nr:MAG: Ribosomal RNA small subunit methyltransferase E [Alphaproteobacteria bacterium MarineAlpha5_Bin11]PPR52191.1 MAG: Ribosomal RNA small subunit methyltransferase E [Alphaproteobacteria bacterium MarineAlpha5_Bin10]|tara:strand:+ start:14151 stop:14888 length:738 start_codon:yes stop_codon:yes gene_type:complete